MIRRVNPNFSDYVLEAVLRRIPGCAGVSPASSFEYASHICRRDAGAPRGCSAGETRHRGEMVETVAEDRQVIAATQSPLLVDEFDLDDIGVLELRDGRTRVRRFDREKYARRLENYSTGQLWEKNLLGGRP